MNQGPASTEETRPSVQREGVANRTLWWWVLAVLAVICVIAGWVWLRGGQRPGAAPAMTAPASTSTVATQRALQSLTATTSPGAPSSAAMESLSATSSARGTTASSSASDNSILESLTAK